MDFVCKAIHVAAGEKLSNVPGYSSSNHMEFEAGIFLLVAF